jgi:hypothetical protein
MTQTNGPTGFDVDDLHVVKARVVLDAISQIAWRSMEPPLSPAQML